jgi:hypothetical protein
MNILLFVLARNFISSIKGRQYTNGVADKKNVLRRILAREGPRKTKLGKSE